MAVPLKILVVDDELPARNRLKEILQDVSENLSLSVVAEASDGLKAVTLLNDLSVDICLLDIRMPGMDGIEVARHAQKLATPPAVIFTTAFDTYAVKAFELNAVDYLLKPIRRERLQAALEKARGRLGTAQAGLEQLQQRARSHLSVSERGRILLVPLDDILFLRAELKYITIKTAEREYLLEESLTNLEQEFADRFARIHRACLVSRQAITGFERVAGEGDGHWVVMLKGLQEKLAVSRRQQHVIRELAERS
ncbi:MAG: LytTR family DNA-binding domain-containing protein [Burkholderiales bacterium]